MYDFIAQEGHGNTFDGDRSGTIEVVDHDGHTFILRPHGSADDAAKAFFAAFCGEGRHNFRAVLTRQGDGRYAIEQGGSNVIAEEQ